MGRRYALAALIGRGEGTKDTESESARDIDWVKVRRVQHGLVRPHEKHSFSRGGLQTREEEEFVWKMRRRAARLAHALAFVAGVLLGLTFLGAFPADFSLLVAALLVACAGLATAKSAA